MSGNTGVAVRTAVPSAAFTSDGSTLGLYHVNSDGTDSSSAAVTPATLRGTPAFAAGKFGNGMSGGVYGYAGVGAALFSGVTMGTGTIEGWLKLAAAPGGNKVAFGRDNIAFVGCNSAGAVFAQAGTSGALTGPSIIDNAWHHAVLDFTGGIARLWLDGAMVATGAVGAAGTSAYAGFGVGGNGTSGTNDWTGSVDEVRASSTVRYAGTATHDATSCEFGTNGLTKGVYTLPAGTDGFGTTVGANIPDGTVEGWMGSTASTIAATRVAFGRNAAVWVGMNTSGNLLASIGASTITTTKPMNDGVLHHVAVVIDKGAARLYCDGALMGSLAGPVTLSAGVVTQAQIGAFNQVRGISSDWSPDGSGWVDEVRFSNVPRYNGTSYTVPVAAFTADALTAGLYHLESDATDSATVALSTPPSIGTITVATAGSTDTITYPAPTAGTNPVAGVALFAGTKSGLESATPVATNTGTGSGTFTQPTPTRGLKYYVVRAFDNSTPTALSSGASNEVMTGTPTLVAPNDAGIVYSPYTWDVTSSRALAINGAAWFRTLIRETPDTVTLDFDVSSLGAPASKGAYRVDRQGGWTRFALAATVPIPMPSTTTAWGSHLLEVILDASSIAIDRWHSPYATAMKFTGITMSPAGSVEAPGSYERVGLAYGDSITEGIQTLSKTGDTSVTSASSLGWAFALRDALGAEIGVVGFGGQGVTANNPTCGSVPTFPSTWDHIADSIARDFTRVPDFVLVNLGTNDSHQSVSTSTFKTGLTAALNLLLAQFPLSTKIIVLRPFGSTIYNLLTYQQAVAATTAPARITVVDTAGWLPDADTTDGTHPFGYINVSKLAPLVAQAVRNVLEKGASWIKKSDGTLKSLVQRRF